MSGKGFKININIGTVIFGILFIYLCITLVAFASKRHIATYQVIEGPLSGNDTYTALILRNEQVVASSAQGFVNFFVKDSSKVASGQYICVVTTEQLDATVQPVGNEEYSVIRRLSQNHVRNYDPDNFSASYDFGNELKSSLQARDVDVTTAGTYYSSPEDQVIVYTTDNYENLTEESLTPEIFDNAEYKYIKTNDQDHVEIGDNLYREIKSEDWAIYFPLTDEQTVRLASRDNISVKFLDDGNTESGKLSFFMMEDQRYAKIAFSKGNIRYADKRFVDVEIITNAEKGLKIPASSVIKKDFYLIPEDYLSYDDDGSASVRKLSYKEDGTKLTEDIPVNLYASVPGEDEKPAQYYIDARLFDDGDVIIKPADNSRFTLNEKASLDGVYCINKGYGIFRRVVILDRNTEFCIVESGTRYGLSLYDYIVENGNSINEEDIVY